jgi:hypothetical protein
MVQILLFEMTDLSMVFPPSPNKIYCSNLPSQAIANAIDGIKLYLKKMIKIVTLWNKPTNERAQCDWLLRGQLRLN